MKIKINLLNSESVKEAIFKIDKYKKSLPEKANRIVTELAKMGAQIVEYSYSENIYEDYEVSCIVNGNSAMIIAEGDDVVFLEFGAGVLTNDYTEGMETEGLPPIYPGSYSETEGLKMFSRYGYWFHAGKKYTGLVPMRGFYFASKEIKEQAVEVAKKVFKR